MHLQLRVCVMVHPFNFDCKSVHSFGPSEARTVRIRMAYSSDEKVENVQNADFHPVAQI